MAWLRPPVAILAAGLSFCCIGAVPVQAAPLVALPEAPLAVAWTGDDRLVVLFPTTVSLFRWTPGRATELDRVPLPPNGARVRQPGGLLRAPPGESALWAMTSLSRGAALFAVEGDRLLFRQQAEVLPWPGSRAGVRFRPDTNLLEGSLAGLGEGPFLTLGHTAEGPVAVAPDGRLLTGAAPVARVGSAVAPLWPGYLATSSTAPPDAVDAVLVIATVGGADPLVRLPQPAAIRALDAAVRGERARLALALQMPEGEGRLAFVEIERPRP